MAATRVEDSTLIPSAHTDPHTHDANGHHPALQHHFDNLEQQRDATTLGMWTFLVTEIMFFGGLFMAYTIYRIFNPEAFAAASRVLEIKYGAINTVVLIASSLTMAMAVYFSQIGNRKLLVAFLGLTMVLGTAFLGIKAIEYTGKFSHNTYPGAVPFEIEHDVVESYERDKGRPFPDLNRVQMFYVIYYGMTGVHALHMVIGIVALGFLTFFAYRGVYSPEYNSPIELTGLYWHFVDIVWIFLFPLLYLIGRN